MDFVRSRGYDLVSSNFLVNFFLSIYRMKLTAQKKRRVRERENKRKAEKGEKIGNKLIN